MVFNKFDVKLKEGEIYELEAVVYGEKINPEKHELKMDVKAVAISSKYLYFIFHISLLFSNLSYYYNTPRFIILLF